MSSLLEFTGFCRSKVPGAFIGQSMRLSIDLFCFICSLQDNLKRVSQDISRVSMNK